MFTELGNLCTSYNNNVKYSGNIVHNNNALYKCRLLGRPFSINGGIAERSAAGNVFNGNQKIMAIRTIHADRPFSIAYVHRTPCTAFYLQKAKALPADGDLHLYRRFSSRRYVSTLLQKTFSPANYLHVVNITEIKYTLLVRDILVYYCKAILHTGGKRTRGSRGKIIRDN